MMRGRATWQAAAAAAAVAVCAATAVVAALAWAGAAWVGAAWAGEATAGEGGERAGVAVEVAVTAGGDGPAAVRVEVAAGVPGETETRDEAVSAAAQIAAAVADAHGDDVHVDDAGHAVAHARRHAGDAPAGRAVAVDGDAVVVAPAQTAVAVGDAVAAHPQLAAALGDGGLRAWLRVETKDAGGEAATWDLTDASLPERRRVAAAGDPDAAHVEGPDPVEDTDGRVAEGDGHTGEGDVDDADRPDGAGSVAGRDTTRGNGDTGTDLDAAQAGPGVEEDVAADVPDAPPWAWVAAAAVLLGAAGASAVWWTARRRGGAGLDDAPPGWPRSDEVAELR